MKETQRTNHVLRHGIMNLLSDEEVASIGVAETVERLLSDCKYTQQRNVPKPKLVVSSNVGLHGQSW